MWSWFLWHRKLKLVFWHRVVLSERNFTNKYTNATNSMCVFSTNLNVGTGNPCAAHVTASVEFDLYSITSYLDFEDTLGKVLLNGSSKTSKQRILRSTWLKVQDKLGLDTSWSHFGVPLTRKRDFYPTMGISV